MSKVVVILGFLVAFAAGMTVGWRVAPPAPIAATLAGDPAKPAREPSEDGPRPPKQGRNEGPAGWLTGVLKLSPEQQGQMKTIWDEAAKEGRHEREKRRDALRKDRDEALAKLMSDSGRQAEFDWIYERYQQRVADLDAEWRAKFQASVEKTKAVLNDEQRAKYEEILSRHAPPQPGGGGPERFPDRKPETRATSRPDRQDPQPSRDKQPLQGADR